jgi:hypothetical protein
MKLSDFKDEKAIEVVAALLVPIGNIAKNKEISDAKGKSKLEFASAMLKNNAADVKDILAILNGKDPAEYHCSAATVLVDLLDMLNDPELMQLFGLQGKTAASSGSASESTEGQKA